MALDRPCGTWKCAPIGRLMPCTSATDAFEKAMPAWVAPSIICSRAARFDGSKQAVRRLAPIRCLAAIALRAGYGLSLRLTKASRPGDRVGVGEGRGVAVRVDMGGARGK